MKVLLINPPSENEIIGNNPPIIEEERGYNPPLGLLFIAGYLEEFTEYSVKVLDTQVEELSYPEIEDIVREKQPEVVGITAMTLTLVDVIKTVKLIKKVNKNIKVVLGGPHVYIFPNETINLEGVDYLVLGEGEEVFKDLLDYMEDYKKLRSIEGLVFKENGKIVNTGPRPLIENLDILPFPARHLVPYKRYSSLVLRRRPITTTFTSRGCPYKCSFCARPHLGKKFRARSAKNVVDEIEGCTKMGIYAFLVYDDTFTVNKRRVIEVCDELRKRKLDVEWDIRARVDTVDEQLLKRLKMAGCRGIHYGIEAGTEKILKVLNKKITISRTKQIFSLTKKNKISTLGYFMIGNPGETREDIFETIKLMEELDPDYVHVTILTPFPATKIYFDGLKSEIIEKDYWKDFSQNPTPDFIPPHWGEFFTKDELVELLVFAYRNFYTRPGYIMKNLVKTRSFSELKRKIKAGVKVLKL
ncbi:Anaerobic magnesium-protoporphyrin IX monomethyl ester cyclase [subsurface metagenome]